jgi:hypothetical protein
MSADTGYVDFTATRTGFPTQTTRFSLAKAKSGVDGDGTVTTVYSVTSSVGAVSKSASGIYTPATVVFSATSTSGNTAPAAYSGRFIIATSTDGTTYTNVATSSVNESSRSYTVPANIKYIRARLYLAGSTTTLLDEEAIPVISDGVNGVNGVNGAAGSNGPLLEISGPNIIYKNSGGALSPATLNLSAITTNIISPTYSWSISGASPVSGTFSSITLTPFGTSAITVGLTVNGSNLTSSISLTRVIQIVEQGVTGQGGQNGIMSAYPTIYRWTSPESQPPRPTVNTLYTWSTGIYGVPTDWSSTTPSNITPGWILWSITIPITEPATAITSSCNWTNTSYPIRAISINGTNGLDGNDGNDGSNGAAGANGSATYLIDRGAGTSSGAPTNEEVIAAVGRSAVAADIATIRYNSGNNSTAYRCTIAGINPSWSLQSTYITGSLIVENSISAQKLTARTITADRIEANSIAVANQFNVYGFITEIRPFDPTNVITRSGSNLIGSFTVTNSSTTTEVKLSVVGIGRTGAIDFSTNDSQTFGVFDSAGLLYFNYGWTPVGQDAKGFSFIFTLPPSSSKTFELRGAKTATSNLSMDIQIITLGVRN